jgi:hypothetical protein
LPQFGDVDPDAPEPFTEAPDPLKELPAPVSEPEPWKFSSPPEPFCPLLLVPSVDEEHAMAIVARAVERSRAPRPADKTKEFRLRSIFTPNLWNDSSCAARSECHTVRERR